MTTNHPLLYATAAAHNAASRVRTNYRIARSRPEAGEGIVGWLIVIVAVAAVALWAVGEFTGEVETKVKDFDLEEAPSAE